ncbi:outer membrane receptor protein involved in Fe transport [Novosphingobium sp. SG707]|nr:outer membrane receptor protein involved in Fe transport [Novosphingobium sp. SG707]
MSFKAGAEYKFSSDLMTYYSFSQGFKSGGWTTRLLDVISPPNDISQLTFRPETANTHELGLKSTLLNRKLRLNLAAFSTDYDNMQVTVYNGLSPVFKNGGKATIRGFEAEAQAKLGELSINGSVGYLDAYYRQLSPGVTFAASNKLVNTPEWSAAFGGFWRHTLANGSALSLAADYSYKSNVHPDAENSRYLQSGNVGMLDGSIGYTGRDERWSLTLGVRNLTDKRFVVGGFDQSSPGSVGFVSATYSPPRQWYLTLRVHD